MEGEREERITMMIVVGLGERKERSGEEDGYERRE